MVIKRKPTPPLKRKPVEIPVGIGKRNSLYWFAIGTNILVRPGAQSPPGRDRAKGEMTNGSPSGTSSHPLRTGRSAKAKHGRRNVDERLRSRRSHTLEVDSKGLD
jgi:hypothetical protein